MFSEARFLRISKFTLIVIFILAMLPVLPLSGGLAQEQNPQGWYEQESGTSKNLSSVSAVNDKTAWVAGESGTIHKTEDQGNK